MCRRLQVGIQRAYEAEWIAFGGFGVWGLKVDWIRVVGFVVVSLFSAFWNLRTP